MLDGLNMEHEPLLTVSFPADLELSDAPLLMGPAGRTAPMDVILGAGGAVLAHLLAATAVVLLAFFQPSTRLQESFLTVNLVAMGDSSGGSGDAGCAEGSARGVPQELSAPDAAPPEQAPAPVPQPTVKQTERVRPAAPKTVKRPTPAVPKPVPDRAAPVTIPEALAASAALTSGDTAAATAAPAGGGGPDAGSPGEGAGQSLAGGPSGGPGLHGREFNAEAVDKIPQPLHRVEPLYPQRARKQGICGKVVLKFLVEADGHVSRPSILEANPAGYFEQSALDAIRHWRFKPGVFRGRAVATWVVLPVQFQLTS